MSTPEQEVISMRRPKMMYSILPLELKLRTQDKAVIDRIYDQNARLVSFLQWYYSKHYGQLLIDNFEFASCTRTDPCKSRHKFEKVSARKTVNTVHALRQYSCEYHGVIMPFLQSAGISISLSIVRNQIDAVLETMKGSCGRRSKVNFENLKHILHVRVTNKNMTKSGETPAEARKREMTLNNDAGGNIFAKANLAKWCSVSGYVGYGEGFNDKLRYQQLINALNGIDGYGVSDPLEMYRTRSGRFILNLAIKKAVNQVEPHGEKTRVMGVNLNMAKFLVAGVINDETAFDDEGKSEGVLSSERDSLFVDADNIIERVFREKYFQARKARRMRKGKRPYKRGEIGDRFARTTKVDKSWLADQYLQLTYRAVNLTIQYALARGVKVIKIEDHRAFNRKKQEYSRLRKKWGNIYKMSKRTNLKAFGLHRAYLRMTKIASMFQYKKFTDDMISEAARYGIEVRVVPPYQSSIKCSRCGYTSGENLESVKKFKCMQCAFSSEADYNTAANNSRI